VDETFSRDYGPRFAELGLTVPAALLVPRLEPIEPR
jgi:hypothetical protein